MAVSKEQKRLFAEKIKAYKSALDDLKKEASTIKGVARGKKHLDPYVTMRVAVLKLQKANTLVLMSKLSMEIQNLKNDTYLNDARKEISALLTEMLNIVGDDIDGSLTENEEQLATIKHVTPRQRLRLVQGLKHTLEDVKETLGANNKWRWSFPDLHYKSALLAKNLFDFKEHGAIKDPNDEFYRDREEMLGAIMAELQYAAQEFRSKYELSTKEVTDLQAVQRIFEALLKIQTLTGQQNDIPKTRTSLDSLNEKIEGLLADKKKKK